MEFCHENLTKKKTESPKGIAPLHQTGALTTELLVEWSLNLEILTTVQETLNVRLTNTKKKGPF